MNKALETKELILNHALGLARTIGFESLSIGELAKKVGMSKSGLFAHFNSKESLQVMILNYAANEFRKNVTAKAIKEPRGIKRLEAIMNHWSRWSTEGSEGSCPLISAAVEFDDRPGVVQEKVKELLLELHQVLKKACDICVEEGDFLPHTDTNQVAQELFSYELSYHLYKKTLGDKKAKQRFQTSIHNLINRYSGK